MRVQSLGEDDPLEEVIATQSRILAWRITWTEEPGGLQSMGSHRVRSIPYPHYPSSRTFYPYLAFSSEH